MAADIFTLIETHVEVDEEEQFGTYFKDFILHWKFATRVNEHGRGIGGLVVGIRKEAFKNNCSAVVKTVNQSKVIELKLPNKTCNIIPLYLRGANWSCDFLQLKSLMEIGLENIILCGDINVRVGCLQQVVDENLLSGTGIDSNRKSKDIVVNANGRRYLELLDEFGLLLMNGRSPDDYNGEYTFISPVGMSVNDLCAVSWGF